MVREERLRLAWLREIKQLKRDAVPAKQQGRQELPVDVSSQHGDGDS